jgi:hypothetical protein
MTDLDERFRALDRLSPPDLWTDIERREPRAMPGPPGVRRALAVAAALVVAAAGVTVAALAFLGGEPRSLKPGESELPAVRTTVDASVRVRWPGSIAVGEGSLWVSSGPEDDSGAGTIVRIDPETAEIVAEIPVPAIPGWETGGGGIEVADDAVWVVGGVSSPGATGGSEGLAVRIDPTTNSVVQEIELGGQFAADVATDGTSLWVSLFGPHADHEVVRIDPGTGRVIARIPLDQEYVRDVLAVDGTIWVHEHRGTFGRSRGSFLTEVDPETNEVARSIPLGYDLTSLTTAAGLIWGPTWVGSDENVLVRFDPLTARFDTVPAGNLDYLIEGGESGLWGRDWEGSRRILVSRFNTSTEEVDASVVLPPDTNPIDLAVAPGSVWVVDYASEVIRIDLE